MLVRRALLLQQHPTLTPDQVKAILEVNAADWTQDLADQRAFFDKIGDRLPKELRDEQQAFAKRLGQ